MIYTSKSDQSIIGENNRCNFQRLLSIKLTQGCFEFQKKNFFAIIAFLLKQCQRGWIWLYQIPFHPFYKFK
jgi:hypothetical protein